MADQNSPGQSAVLREEGNALYKQGEIIGGMLSKHMDQTISDQCENEQPLTYTRKPLSITRLTQRRCPICPLLSSR